MENIHQTTFEEVWKFERWQALREVTLTGQYDKPPVCKLCQQSV